MCKYQKLLTKSYYARLLAVRSVIQDNREKNCGYRRYQKPTTNAAIQPS
ncbi:MAG: reverse transcriptase N-terminal domain-containing protein [Trichodesmium sp. St16_bin4-tuft]|nr:reverse transcriptase N-terminal domain-containing protein [Trichodesmium sp. St16_bin4-tuft]MDE5122769.1 reverse transcriptase N-terminal domain-containing protein [Trichodesmium sp. St19_bin1]